MAAAAAATEEWKEAKEQGNKAYMAGQHEAAIAHFTRAIQLETPANGGQQLHILHSNRSAARLSLGLAQEALQDALKCVDLQPAFVKGYSRVGAALYRLGRYGEAVAAYAQGLEREPGNRDLTKALAEARKAAEETKPPSLAELTPKTQEFLQQNRLAARLFLPRLFLLLNGLVYLLPFLVSAAWSYGCYRRVLFTALGVRLYALYSVHGFPKRSLQYLAEVMQDSNAPPLFLCMLLLSFKGKAYVLGVAPLLLQEAMQTLWFFAEFMHMAQPATAKNLAARWVGAAVRYTGKPRYGTLTSGRDRWQLLFQATEEYGVVLEIAMGLFLVAELLTPYRNLFGLFLYWQFLQMRYMLDRSGVVKAHFTTLDDKLLALTTHPRCPAVVAQLHQMVRGYMGRAVAIPDPAQQQQQGQGGGMLSRCSIM